MAKEQDFEFIRGDTKTIVFSLKDSEGNPLILVGSELYFTMKKSYKTEDYILQKKYTKGEIIYTEDGQIKIPLSHTDTGELDYGEYVYDVQLKSNTFVTTVLLGSITLTDEATWISNE